MTTGNPEITDFIDGAGRWREEMEEVRKILLECDLSEEVKWGKPCYTAHGGNIVIMQPFKAHLSLMFFKGALLDDPEGILRSQGENTRAALRIEFTSPEQVTELSSTLKSYVAEAVAIEEAGLEVPKKDVSEYEVPAEFEARLREDEAYREAFEALTPGRKKGYLLHFS
ncbi:MAG: YdeI/OmpD-associated family protein, partial [Gemmatimonadota bacterium]